MFLPGEKIRSEGAFDARNCEVLINWAIQRYVVLLGGGRPPHEWVNLEYDWIFKVCVELQLQSLILQCNYNVCTKKFKKSHGGPNGEKKLKEKKRRKEGKTTSEIKESSNIHLWVEKKLYGPGRNWP